MGAPVIEPMLAGYGLPSGPLTAWAAEPKLDGWRAVVTVVDGQVTVSSRRGCDLHVPELAALGGIGVSVVLDGELVAGTGTSESFYGLAPTLARRGRTRSTLGFAAFDLLYVDGHLTVDLCYDDRRRLLDQLELPPPAVVVPSWPGDDVDTLLEACARLDVEGVVLKRHRSLYTSGRRSASWRKVKCAAWRELHLERRRAAVR